MEFKLKNKLDVSEAELFSELHHFLLRKNNRILSNDEVIEKTGVSSELIHKWVKTGKLNNKVFPNLGFPCERCGKITNRAKTCSSCTKFITSTLAQEAKDQEWFNHIQKKNSHIGTYHYR